MSQHTEIADPSLENEQIQDPNPVHNSAIVNGIPEHGGNSAGRMRNMWRFGKG